MIFYLLNKDMEALNKFAPKRLSIKARDFVLYCHQHRQEAEHTQNKVAYFLKHYPQASSIKPATARDWHNTYTVINGNFVIKWNDVSELNVELRKIGFALDLSDSDNYQIITIEEAERIRAAEYESEPNFRVFTIENAIVDPTLKREYVKQKELK